jgi:O-antigen/teichoic acid export membrane protein
VVGEAKNGVVSAVAWSAARSWGTRVATLLVFFILTRLLNPEEIGLVNYLLGLLTVLGVFADLGLAEYIVYNHQSTRQIELGIWWFQVTFSCLISVSLIGMSFLGWLGFEQANNQTIWVLVILAVTLPLSAAARIPEALLRRQMDYKSLAVRSLLAISVSSTVAILLAIKGYGIWSLVFKQLLEVVIDVFFCFKLSQWRPAFYFSMVDLRHALTGGWGIVASRIMDVIAQRADTLIIGGVFGMRDLGFYSIGQKVFQVLSEGITQPVTGVIATAYGRVKEDTQRLKQLFLISVKFSSMLTAPVFMAAIALSLDWIPLVFGQQWQASATVTQVLCIAGLMSGYTSLCGFALLALNQNKSYVMVMLLNFLLSLGLLAILSRHGFLAASAALPLKIALSFPLSFYLAKQLLGFGWLDYLLALKEAAVLVIIVAVAWLVCQQYLNQGLLADSSSYLIAIAKAIVVGGALIGSVRWLYWGQVKTLHQALKAAV